MAYACQRCSRYRAGHSTTNVLMNDRIGLARDVRKLSSRSSAEAMKAIQDKRTKLQKEIDHFCQRSAIYLPSQESPAMPTSSNPDEWYDLEDDDNDDFESPAAFIETVDIAALPPERQMLPLPSSLGKGACQGQIKQLAELELDLRIGQANDTLRFLRIAIGQKSFLYRTKIRSSSGVQGYSKRLRGFSDVQTLQMSIDHAAKVYMSIRKAMECLGASEQTLSRYAVLTKSDIVASTAVADPNASGQRNKALSWIWRMRKDESANPEWLDECTSNQLSVNYLSHEHSISRKLASCKIAKRSMDGRVTFDSLRDPMDNPLL